MENWLATVYAKPYLANHLGNFRADFPGPSTATSYRTGSDLLPSRDRDRHHAINNTLIFYQLTIAHEQ